MKFRSRKAPFVLLIALPVLTGSVRAGKGRLAVRICRMVPENEKTRTCYNAW